MPYPGNNLVAVHNNNIIHFLWYFNTKSALLQKITQSHSALSGTYKGLYIVEKDKENNLEVFFESDGDLGWRV